MRKLTPFDSETILMAETLSDNVLVIENPANYTLRVFYKSYKRNVNYVNAIKDAVCGRVGKRLEKCVDDKKFSAIDFVIKYDPTMFPDIEGDFDEIKKQDVGTTYVSAEKTVEAIRVNRDIAGTLRKFVGNGRMIIESRLNGGKAHFEFVNNGTFVSVPKHSFIIRDGWRIYTLSEKTFNARFKPVKLC